MTSSKRPQVRGGIFCAAALAVAAISYSSISSADPLALGAVERVDVEHSVITVLGQQYYVSPGTLVTSESAYPQRLSLASVAKNSLVWVDGTATEKGVAHVDEVIVLPETNVPGSTQVLVTGVVSAVSSDGSVKVGSLKIDTTPTLTSSGSQVSVGDFVEVAGTQPVSGGVLLAQSVAHTAGVGGTGKVSTAGVGGTGKVSTLGVGGTGKIETFGVGGTGKVSTAGVGGTGKNVSAAGVGGTGKNVSAAGVGGTGKNVSAAGVGGTGKNVSAAGVGGTGKNVSAAGVGGTGKNVSAAGVGGTGKVSTAGVGGTGKVSTAGVGGTGKVSTAGVGGTGKVSTAGVGGTGKVSTAGVGGTGKVSTAGVGGTA